MGKRRRRNGWRTSATQTGHPFPVLGHLCLIVRATGGEEWVRKKNVLTDCPWAPRERAWKGAEVLVLLSLFPFWKRVIHPKASVPSQALGSPSPWQVMTLPLNSRRQTLLRGASLQPPHSLLPLAPEKHRNCMLVFGKINAFKMSSAQP